ncbi:MAG: Uncharacterised protein [Cellulomonadaceae bacterium TMED98]|nr:MAG: Uncharacterised protein [Cellulomonadaceae bacterium TMED98]
MKIGNIACNEVLCQVVVAVEESLQYPGERDQGGSSINPLTGNVDTPTLSAKPFVFFDDGDV